MAHAAARRCGPAGDKPSKGLRAAALGLRFYELRRVLLGRAANFPDHDDGVGGRVGEEHFKHGDELGSLDGIAADADRGRLAQSGVGGLLHRLVGERAGPGDDADLAGLEDIARHDADLAGVGGEHARAVGADETRPGAIERALHLDHVEHRNALGDAHDERYLGVDSLKDCIGGEAWWHIDRCGGGARLLLGLHDRLEDRHARKLRIGMLGASLAGGHATHDLRAIGQRLLRVEGPLAAGDALADNPGRLVDKDGHRRAPMMSPGVVGQISDRIKCANGCKGEARKRAQMGSWRLSWGLSWGWPWCWFSSNLVFACAGARAASTQGQACAHFASCAGTLAPSWAAPRSPAPSLAAPLGVALDHSARGAAWVAQRRRSDLATAIAR